MEIVAVIEVDVATRYPVGTHQTVFVQVVVDVEDFGFGCAEQQAQLIAAQIATGPGVVMPVSTRIVSIEV